jgi:PAS domain S-box-containing protein
LPDFQSWSVYDGAAVLLPIKGKAVKSAVLVVENELKNTAWHVEDLNLLKTATQLIDTTYLNALKREAVTYMSNRENELRSFAAIVENLKSELKSKQEQLQEIEHQVAQKESESKAVLDSINDHNLVVEYDLKGNISWMNDKTRELTGIRIKDFKGANRYSIKSLLLRSNRFSQSEYENFWTSLTRGVSKKYELKLMLPGNELWVAVTFLPILGESDSLSKVLAVAHDISTVKKQQRFIEKQNHKLKEQRKENIRINNNLEQRVAERTEQLEKQNKQLTEYAFINAHLLRAPVCNILGLVDLLKGHTLDDDQLEVMNYLDNSAKELDEMVMKINRSIKKGYYDDPFILEQVERWNQKKLSRQQAS